MKKVGHRESVSTRPAQPSDRARLASQVLTFLAADAERLGRFLALTGLDPSTIRAAVGGQGFTDAVLGYLAGDEALLIAFARSEGLDPALVGRLAQDDPADRWTKG